MDAKSIEHYIRSLLEGNGLDIKEIDVMELPGYYKEVPNMKNDVNLLQVLLTSIVQNRSSPRSQEIFTEHMQNKRLLNKKGFFRDKAILEPADICCYCEMSKNKKLPQDFIKGYLRHFHDDPLWDPTLHVNCELKL